jgi:hypothetical protein
MAIYPCQLDIQLGFHKWLVSLEDLATSLIWYVWDMWYCDDKRLNELYYTHKTRNSLKSRQ